MKREIKLDGSEITLLKAIGTSGAPIFGKLFLERIGEIGDAELLETLDGLISLDYVMSNKVNIREREDVERALFRVNPAFARELRDAMNPSRRRQQERSHRQRRA